MGEVPSVRKRIGCSIEELQRSMDIEDEDLFSYSKATTAASHGNDKLIKAFPATTEKKISLFYSKLRDAGIYPAGIGRDGVMEYSELVDYDEAWKRALKDSNRYPTPPKDKFYDDDLPF